MGAIGRYEIESLIGKGAMGVVFLARDPQLGRPVALKTYDFPQGLASEAVEEFKERLLREAHAAAVLSHTNIVTVHDAGVDPAREIPYIVMEYVPGPSLKQLLDGKHRLAPEMALRFGDALADALDAAHRAGIIHRDIKPANILVRETDGIVKITDFGVARLAASELTRTGALVGSPAYMSPEQIRGAVVDARSDLFSLAVVLYEALTAKRPFAGDDLPSVAYAVAHTPPYPLQQHVADLPRELDIFFSRALAKRPEERFADGAAFRSALREAGTAILPAPKKGRRTKEKVVSMTGSGRHPKAAKDLADTEPGTVTASQVSPAAHAGAPEPAAAIPRSGGARFHLGLFATAVLFVATLCGVPLVLANRSARLGIDARSISGTFELSVQLDGRELDARQAAVYQTGGAEARTAGDPDASEAWVKVPPGHHALRAEVRFPGEPDSLTDTITLDLGPGERRILRLTSGRGPGLANQLKIE